jgi:hypothetical protein
MTTLPSGQIIPVAPALHTPPVQNQEGSAIEAAARRTMASNAAQIAAFKSLGAGQKGGRRKFRGGANLNASIPFLPTANSIPGVSHEQNHLDGVNNLNQLRASAVGDKLSQAAPYQAGGKRTRRKANGRGHKRTHRRRNNKPSANNRGRSRRVLRRRTKAV